MPDNTENPENAENQDQPTKGEQAEAMNKGLSAAIRAAQDVMKEKELSFDIVCVATEGEEAEMVQISSNVDDIDTFSLLALVGEQASIKVAKYLNDQNNGSGLITPGTL